MNLCDFKQDKSNACACSKQCPDRRANFVENEKLKLLCKIAVGKAHIMSDEKSHEEVKIALEREKIDKSRDV